LTLGSGGEKFKKNLSILPLF